MRFFRRKPKPISSKLPGRHPSIELLEDRNLLSTSPLSAHFDAAAGLLSLAGTATDHAAAVSLSGAGFVEVTAGDRVLSSDPYSASYASALAGATAQSLKAIQLSGDASGDDLILGNLHVAGGLSVSSDGIVDVQGQLSAAGAIQISAHAALLGGQLQSAGFAVSADNVIQSGAVVSAASVRIDAAGSYLATISALTSAAGFIAINADSLFSSGRYSSSSEIDLFGGEVHLVGATIDASGTNGGWVRIGGDSPVDIAAHGGNTAGVRFADVTTVDATTTIHADAVGSGNGGTVVVWSQTTTTFGGTLSANGAGAGHGGLLEVSSAGQLNYGGTASATAPSGQAGRLLLDPKNITIDSAFGLPQFSFLPSTANVQGSFGESVVVLSNGNVVVTDPTSNLTQAGAGAVYLYNGQTGALLATLTGSTANDGVGSSGVTALSNGNYVVSSPSWQVSFANPVGAVTWRSGTGGGGTAVVSAANSLIGSTINDQVGIGDQLPGHLGVIALTNGNYVVNSPFWQDNGGNVVGAVTWGNGATGITGLVSASNSLVGSTTGDQIGATFNGSGVTPLTNGNYVVSSPSWQLGGVQVGAATWANGLGGTVGAVSASNSLVGVAGQGFIATGGAVALTNGNYVVVSSDWSAAGAVFGGQGAVTWATGSTSTAGQVDATNSLIGSDDFDHVGIGGVTALANGNYVVSSPNWQNGSAFSNFGAVTWGDGTQTTSAVVSTANSLYGSTQNDLVGGAGGGVTALTNGKYVVSSPNWHNGINAVGAVTLASGTAATAAAIGTGNSLTGSSDGDTVGSGGVTALTNGNYVVDSPNWQLAGNAVVGAITWLTGTSTTSAAVTVNNSLVGASTGDNIGSGGVVALTNGNYVVSSPNWQNAGNLVGAVTLGNGASGTTGTVGAGNSLVGTANNDQVGSGGVVALSNGNYVVVSPDWNGGKGAATWASGTTGRTFGGAGSPSATNSLIGTVANSNLKNVAGLAGGDAFVAAFGVNNGSVFEMIVSGSMTFSTGSGQDVNLSRDFITATLNTGTDVVLQASNDIKINSAIIVNNLSGNGGNLTLQAGRSIEIHAAITTDNGNLTLIANDTAAHGVIDSQRDPGLAGILTTVGANINAGTGDVTMILADGAGNTNFSNDDITIRDLVAHNLTVTKMNPLGGGVDLAGVITVSGDLSITSAGDILQMFNTLSVAGTTDLTSAEFIDLSLPGNSFGGLVSLAAPGVPVSITATGDVKLETSSAPSQLTVNAGGIISQVNTPLLVSGASSFTGSSIVLDFTGNALQGPVSLSSAGSITLVNGTNLTVGDLTLGANASISGGNLTFTGTVDVGSHTLTLTTSAAKFSGTTTLAGGTITDALGITVGAGGTLSGNGTLTAGTGAAGVTVQIGGTLTADAATSGLTINGDLTLSAASVVSLVINSASQYSKLTVNGDITLNGATVGVTFNGYTPANDHFTLITNVPGHAVNGVFAPIVGPNNVTISANYAGGAGHDVVLGIPPVAPVANNDSKTINANSAATAINVLANDTGTGIHISAVSQGLNGTVVITGGGTGLTYQPNGNFTGTDVFTYTISDGFATATGVVIVGVTAVNTAPVITVPAAQQFTPNKTLVITGTSINDPDFVSVVGQVTVTVSALHGVLTLANTYGLGFTVGNGTANSTMTFSGYLPVVNLALTSLTYKPNTDFGFADTITITVNDQGNFGGGALTDQKTIAVNPRSGNLLVPDPILAGKQDLVVVGTAGNDTISVTKTAVVGMYTVKVNGVSSTIRGVTGRVLVFDETGNNTINIATVALSTVISVGDGNNTVTGGAGIDTITVGNGSNVIQGSAGNDLIAVGSGSNTIDGGIGVNTLVESGDVNFTLVSGTTRTNGSITKGAATDTLVLNHISKARVTSLSTTTARTIDGSQFAAAVVFIGGGAHDILKGGTGTSILVGGSGGATITGGTGANVLIAGTGGATITGGAKQDLIIGGSTNFDHDFAALDKIMAEWGTTTIAYATRIKHLMGTLAGGFNGTTKLTTSTVHNNVPNVNVLTGGGGQDWFWAHAANEVTDLNNGGTETLTAIP